MDTHKLVTRDFHAPIAFLTKPVKSLGATAGTVDTKTFLSHVYALAEALDAGSYAINLCGNRYLFMVSFCAAILRGQTNLLPPNKNVSTQTQLADTYAGSYVIHDGVDVDPSLHSIDLSLIELNPEPVTSDSIPTIANDQLSCISFTSGSTGNSKPNLKYWKTLHRSSAINFRHMIHHQEQTVFQLATMPAQHMWGLETSVLLPMFHNLCMCDAQPLFPQDIVDTLERLPSPTLLVSTPVHLRALTMDDSHKISLVAVLCATSPLTQNLAQKIESQFSCDLREVYGCSEVGSMAVRRTAIEQEWTRFDGIEFSPTGQTTVASAAHLPEATVLQDQIEVCGERRFKLAGRSSDLIKIAGKRGSLYEINQVLLRFEGLNDGIVFHPDINGSSTDRGANRLCAIVALKDGVDKAMLNEFLRAHLDSAFIPRPVYVVESLPRESNGKLLKKSILNLLAALRN